MRTSARWETHPMAVGVFEQIHDAASQQTMKRTFSAAMLPEVDVTIATKLLWRACVECVRKDVSPATKSVRLAEILQELTTSASSTALNA